jgi:hypothetical protein
MKLTDFLKSINDTKQNVMDSDSNCEKLYPAFVSNRCLSYFMDTILHANNMNLHFHIDNKLQYDYYIYSIRKRKRFSRWDKSESSDDLEFIKEHYGYSDRKAKDAMSILGKSGVEKLRIKYTRGGRS